MLFFSKEFLFIFIPILSIISLIFIKLFKNYDIYKILLIVSSMIFYGYWSIKFLILFFGVIVFNFLCVKYYQRNNKNFYTILFAIFINLFILIYFKYFNFLVENINEVFNLSYNVKNIILPLGISFIIFQQIAYLWTNISKNNKHTFQDYLLFSFFFPQIIAGPILIVQDVMHQFKGNFPNFKINNIWSGILLFSIGIFKKIFIADNIEAWVNGPFSAIIGNSYNSLEYFIALISYGIQLYFDFSAYSDMAIGLGLMFGVVLPLNFNSPYKAKSISEFWTTWHMTLNRFLETMIYFPIALQLKRLNLKNNFNQVSKIIFISTMATFLISGIWHGAGWNFILWGLYHGLLVASHRFYLYLVNENIIKSFFSENNLNNFIKILLTNIFVFISWILFRSADVSSSLNFATNLFNIFDGSWNMILEKEYLGKLIILTLLMNICWFFPNSNQIINTLEIIKDKKNKQLNIFLKVIKKMQKLYLDVFIVIVFILTYVRYNAENSPFLYYQF